jgi:hypothetical protein
MAAANDEIVDIMSGVNLHDMPENRQPSYLDHWLWSHGGLFRKAGTETAGEDYSFHNLNISLTPRALIVGLQLRGANFSFSLSRQRVTVPSLIFESFAIKSKTNHGTSIQIFSQEASRQDDMRHNGQS